MQLQLCDEPLGQPNQVARQGKRVLYICPVAQWAATASYKKKGHLEIIMMPHEKNITYAKPK
jgi:hypothetical protein